MKIAQIERSFIERSAVCNTMCRHLPETSEVELGMWSITLLLKFPIDTVPLPLGSLATTVSLLISSSMQVVYTLGFKMEVPPWDASPLLLYLPPDHLTQ